jgi:hypothetical protein
MTGYGPVVIIGRLSRVRNVGPWVFLTLIAAALGSSVLWGGEPLSFNLAACLLTVLGLWLLWSRLAYLALKPGAPGLYVRDGVLYDSVWGRSAPLDHIKVAYRAAERGLLRTDLMIEVRGARPTNAAYPEVSRQPLGASAFQYETPISVMLERLEACGVKVKGSKTGLIGA